LDKLLKKKKNDTENPVAMNKRNETAL